MIVKVALGILTGMRVLLSAVRFLLEAMFMMVVVSRNDHFYEQVKGHSDSSVRWY